MVPDNTNNRSDPPLVKESRRLKTWGLVLIGVSFPTLSFLMDKVESKAWLTYQDKWQIVSMVLLYLVASNIFVLGLFVLRAGFNNLHLLSNARARLGTLVKMAGANALILIYALVGFGEYGAFEEIGEVPWFVLFGLFIFIFFLRIGIVLLRRGWKYDAVSAEKVLKQDTRPPVVYIRSFKDDTKTFMTTVAHMGFAGWLSMLIYRLYDVITVEQELAKIMHRVGPVVAIGKPGESLPELGAARLYVGDDEWRVRITDLMMQARLVIIRTGTTMNLWWEIDQAARLLPLRQLVLVSLGQGEDAKKFEKDIENRFGRLESFNLPPKTKSSPFSWFIRMGIPSDVDMGKIIYFGDDLRPIAEPIRLTHSWKEYIQAFYGYGPYQVSLESAFRNVFGQLDLPWIDHKNRVIAIMLALVAGIFGFHHFYLGNRKRGLYCVGFCWTGIPTFLGWIDAIRMVLMDEQQFELRYVYHSQTQGP